MKLKDHVFVDNGMSDQYDPTPTCKVCQGSPGNHSSSLFKSCDGCQKLRRDVKACGQDANGDPDAPDLCFVCRKENERRRSFDIALGKYVSWERHLTIEDILF